MTTKEKTPFFEDVPSLVKSDELEQELLQYWEKENIFARSLEQNKDKPLYTFYDGPPYATGRPHYGHILQSAIKDTVLRYKTMKGFYVPRRVGWDCHGLPVENLVEKELGFKTKRDIEQYGIAKFNERCRQVVFRYIKEFTNTLRRMGRWADYEHGYATLDREYMESEWWVFKQLWEQGLVYKAFRSTPYCIRCATPLSNFETSMAYKDRTDQAVYALFKVDPDRPFDDLSEANEDLWLLIWTTTPWTLPANMAMAFNPEIEYVSVLHEGRKIILAKNRIKDVFGEEKDIKKEWTPAELRGLPYVAPYTIDKNTIFIKHDYSVVDEQEVRKATYQLYEADFVTADEGTGLVHIAPAFGEDDYELAKKQMMPSPTFIRNIDAYGRFEKSVEKWGGMSIWEANEKIIADLKERKVLLKAEAYPHSYPHCWRCDTPLIYYALDTWFIKVSDLKEHMLQLNQQISWIPEHVKEGRFAKGIESAPDWAVSRNRFWSVPLPVWECEECRERVCVGSLKELQEYTGKEDIPDLHRPYVDQLTWNCSKCGKTMRRTPEVLDAWFDSGSMPYAQWHYPFAKKQFVEKGFPADFIAESIEMTRAWFYVLHVLATALTRQDIGLGHDKPAFTNAIASGIIFAEDGQKLSKKLKNYPEIEPTIVKYGADTLRLYLLNSSVLGEPYRFSEKDLQQVHRNVYLRLWNVYSFFVRYANIHNWRPSSDTDVPQTSHLLDRWILAKTRELENYVISLNEKYRLDFSTRYITRYIDSLSNWYVRRSRARFQASASNQERQEALNTLFNVLVRFVKLLAPFMPFVTEEIFRNLTGKDSVHLQQMNNIEQLSIHDQTLLQEMTWARIIVLEGLSLRARAGIKVRQPLTELAVKGHVLSEDFVFIMRDEVNVKRVVFVKELSERQDFIISDHVGLNIAITPELKAEGIAREIIRHGQVLRRQVGYALDERIVVLLMVDDEDVRQAFAQHREMILQKLQADEIEEKGAEDAGKDLVLEGKKVHLGVRKVIRNNM